MNKDNSAIAELFTTKKIRQKANEIYELTLKGQTHFNMFEEKLSEVARYVSKITLEHYPDLKVPLHSRLNHFQAGGVDRLRWAKENFLQLPPEERPCSWFDLVIISVLLDAGAGEDWSYQEKNLSGLMAGQRRYPRSEGLALASFQMFFSGFFSNSKNNPWRVEGQRLTQITADELAEAMQSNQQNMLQGLTGRCLLLQRLGQHLLDDQKYFGPEARLGMLAKNFEDHQSIQASNILTLVLESLGPIWPSRITLNHVSLGDAWVYPRKSKVEVGNIVPFHKLSQWLTYSLVDVLVRQGIKVNGVDELTGLPEYRNGGLFLDFGVLEWKDPNQALNRHKVDSDAIIEWRALTVVLLDHLATLVRQQLNCPLSMGQILEGGTWLSGRILAKEKRKNGASPIQIQSDGTVF